jgi:hypothetical protein
VAHGQFTKLAGESHLLLMAQMLFTKENDFPFEQCRADGVDFLRR